MLTPNEHSPRFTRVKKGRAIKPGPRDAALVTGRSLVTPLSRCYRVNTGRHRRVNVRCETVSLPTRATSTTRVRNRESRPVTTASPIMSRGSRRAVFQSGRFMLLPLPHHRPQQLPLRLQRPPFALPARPSWSDAAPRPVRQSVRRHRSRRTRQAGLSQLREHRP